MLANEKWPGARPLREARLPTWRLSSDLSFTTMVLGLGPQDLLLPKQHLSTILIGNCLITQTGAEGFLEHLGQEINHG